MAEGQKMNSSPSKRVSAHKSQKSKKKWTMVKGNTEREQRDKKKKKSETFE